MDQQNVVGVFAVAIERAVHARCPDRHTWYGQADRLRFFFQETLDIGSRHMAFDGIAADSGGMTGAKLSCDAKLFPYSGVDDIESADLDAGCFKMLDPFVRSEERRVGKECRVC